MLSIRGSDNGYKIKYRKNLTGLDFTIDNTNIVTKIMPQGYNGLLLLEKYVESPIINQYPHPKIKIIEFSDVKVKENEEEEEGFETVEEAYEELRRLSALKYSEENIDKPLINLKIDFVELSKTTEYDKYSFLGKVAMGDVVSVELDYTKVNVRVIKTTYDSLLHRFIALELGEFKNDYITSNKKLTDENKDINSRLDAQGNLINSQGQMINSQGELINKYGTRIDEQGRLIDSQGNLINEQGLRIDAQGELLNEQKTQIDAQGNLIDEQGRLINSQGALINEYGQTIDEHGNLISEQEQQLSSQQILLDEHGNLINEHGQKIDSQGNLIKEVSDKVAALPTEEEILNQAKENATNLISKATNGYVVLRPAENPTEILIMDTADVNTAQKIWRWNLNGLGYSNKGINGPYEQAMTQDGQIVADFIKTRNIKCKSNKSRNYEC